MSMSVCVAVTAVMAMLGDGGHCGHHEAPVGTALSDEDHRGRAIDGRRWFGHDGLLEMGKVETQGPKSPQGGGWRSSSLRE